jgi:hypothetical protein
LLEFLKNNLSQKLGKLNKLQGQEFENDLRLKAGKNLKAFYQTNNQLKKKKVKSQSSE